MGVNLFKGAFFSCVDASTGKLVDNVSNKSECLHLNNTMWYNKKINFDHVGNGYLALFELATFSGWQDVIAIGVDAAGIDLQPKREINYWAYLYFVSFVIFGSLFTMNLFVGVIIDNFNSLKRKVIKFLFFNLF